MPIPINPISKAAASLTQTLAQASNAFNSATGGLSLPAGTDLKALSAKVNALGGGIGSALNGITGNINGAAASLSGFGQGITTAAGTIGSGITSIVGNVGGAGGIAGAAAAIAGIGSAVGALGNTIASISSAGTLGGSFGQLSAAAGQINNLLSLTRGKSLPSGGELFKTTGSAALVTPVNSNDWRVRLRIPFDQIFPEAKTMFKPLADTNGLIWPYLPNIKIATKANYKTENPIHNNFPYQFYQNSQVEDITIDGEFSVQNQVDGLYWIAATMFLRTATKMFYGQGNFAGNPPVICTLSGYGTQVFNNVPVVIKNFSVDLKDDVNYIQVNVNGAPTWVPAMSTISVTLSPMYNRQSMRQFSLQRFAAGGEVGMI